MSTEPSAMQSPRWMYWTGWGLSVLPCLLLVMSAAMKLTNAEVAVEGFKQSGYDPGLLVPLGITELACTILYLVPQTAVLGAILLTGYLGGATSTHVLHSEPFLIPIVLGVVLWLGIFLRDARLRALVPLRR